MRSLIAAGAISIRSRNCFQTGGATEFQTGFMSQADRICLSAQLRASEPGICIVDGANIRSAEGSPDHILIADSDDRDEPGRTGKLAVMKPLEEGTNRDELGSTGTRFSTDQNVRTRDLLGDESARDSS